MHGRCGREARDEGRGAELGGARAGREDVADGDVLDEGRVDARAGDQRREGVREEVGGGCVFEATLAAASERGAEGAGDDDVGRGFLEDVMVLLLGRG